MDRMLFTLTETAEMLGVSRWTLHRILKNFELGYVMPIKGRTTRMVPRRSIEKWIESQTITSNKEAIQRMDGRRK